MPKQIKNKKPVKKVTKKKVVDEAKEEAEIVIQCHYCNDTGEIDVPPIVIAGEVVDGYTEPCTNPKCPIASKMRLENEKENDEVEDLDE